MKFISNTTILALAGSASARDLQLGGIFGGSDNETSISGGLADTVSGAVDTVSGAVGGIVDTTSGAIGDFVGENTTLPDVSIEWIANATQDFVSGVVNTTSNMIPDFNGTLDGFIPEGGLGPVIPEESNESSPDSCGCQSGDGTFCGTDGLCHFYNCESFYEFGPVDYTGTA